MPQPSVIGAFKLRRYRVKLWCTEGREIALGKRLASRLIGRLSRCRSGSYQGQHDARPNLLYTEHGLLLKVGQGLQS